MPTHPRVPITTYLPPELAERLCARAAADDRSIAGFVRRAVDAALNDSSAAALPRSSEDHRREAAGDAQRA